MNYQDYRTQKIFGYLSDYNNQCGTSLISLYIPRGYTISKVVQQLV